MRIDRGKSRLSFSRRRRRSGKLSSVMLLGVLVGFFVMSWSWLERRLTSFAPMDNSSLIAAARDAFSRGDLDTVIALAKQTLERDPAQADAIGLLARALVYRSYYDYDTEPDRTAALELTTQAVEANPSNLDLRATHAFVLQANRQFTRAAEIAQRVLDESPDHVLARASLALAYGAAGAHQIALRESQQAVRVDPTQIEAQRSLAISYGDTGSYDNALRTIEIAISLNSRLVPLYYERALYALQLGDADTATFSYMQVLALNPDNVKARLRLCELSSLLREREQAIDYCSQVTDLAPNWYEGWYQLGREFFLQGEYEAAQRSLNKCSTLQVMQGVEVEERELACWYLQGQAAEIRGDCPALIATYNEFLTMTNGRDLRQTWTYPPEGPVGCTAP